MALARLFSFPAPQTESAERMTTTAPANHLLGASSPYLLQHAHNPVDWYEWGPEALDKARAENKPIFLSIGYAACHWCHVMAHESFEDPAVAAVLNASFVNIKVDREQRPDLDEIYMQATLALNDGQGGWPMSVWLTPDLNPFFAGTYFPPASRYGRSGFKEVCQRIAEAWRDRRAEIAVHADQLAGVVRARLRVAAAQDAALPPSTLDEAADALAQAFDAERGGMSCGGGTNKFPPSMALDVLLRSAARRPLDDPVRKGLLELAELTLDRMATGGIYDQLGGGIHRYSTDLDWHVPHFEKMLYDQALVSRCYLDAYQLTGKPLYARVAREILDYVLADLQSPGGGLYSARDADSDGQEGRYYVWTRAEVLAALGREDAELFCGYYDVTCVGNWHDPHDPSTPKNVLRTLRDMDTLARLYCLEPAELEERLVRGREQLRTLRAQRVPPALDDKILCEWNGLMIASLARGGCVLGEPRYVQAAARAADFILTNQYRAGRLLRSWRAGRTLDTAFLSDYACLIEGLIELYEATFDRRWLDAAARLNHVAIELFWDEPEGGFFFTAADHEPLIARSKYVHDGAAPSGNSVQLMNLLRLAALFGDERSRTLADRMMTTFAAEVRRAPWVAERFLAGVDFALAGPVEVVIVGDGAAAPTQALLAQVHRTYLPNRVLMLLDPRQPDAAPPAPLLRGRTLVDGRPAAYVCRDGACRQPVTTPEELTRELHSDAIAPVGKR
jgi:uncharacterized protein YyaL (SSP411 family)